MVYRRREYRFRLAKEKREAADEVVVVDDQAEKEGEKRATPVEKPSAWSDEYFLTVKEVFETCMARHGEAAMGKAFTVLGYHPLRAVVNAESSSDEAGCWSFAEFVKQLEYIKDAALINSDDFDEDMPTAGTVMGVLRSTSLHATDEDLAEVFVNVKEGARLSKLSHCLNVSIAK